ncbi:MAG TPA: cbb3-type cytochrome c oxidase subunit 3 [Candidatus Acidoferrum sp.]|nr:cbb3-type cytochrome c oxidase subunit 3 [Candidatus Acidoferrum sp.]
MWTEDMQFYAYMTWMTISIVLFLLILAWALWPGSRERFQKYADIPLHDDEDEARS